MSRQSVWLLKYLAERYPLGISPVNALPCFDLRDKPGMVHLRGLQRRGWVREATQGNVPWGRGIGVYYITEAGLEAAKTL